MASLRRAWSWSALGALLLSAPASAVVLPGPSLGISVSGDVDMSISVPLVETVPGSGIWELVGNTVGGSWLWSDDPLNLNPQHFEIEICSSVSSDPSSLCHDPSGVIDPITSTTMFDQDPFIKYLSGVQDHGAPSSFSFTFTQGIVPTAAPGLVSHDQSSSTTDNNNNGVPVTPGAPPAGVPVDSDGNPEIYVYTLSTNGGTTLANADLDLRQAFVGPTGTSGGQAGLDEGPIAGPIGSGFYDFMRVDVNFSMGGGGDIITFNGRADVIPEPGTAALLALGLTGLAVLGRRRA